MADFGQEIKWWKIPYQEAVDYFLAKTPMTTAEFNALSAELRARAFTVGYVHSADLMQEVWEALAASLQKGLTYADFSRATEGILTNSFHRRTVFNTNILSAYGRGHWEQAQAAKELRPFVRFSAVIDGRTSLQCRLLHGTVLPLDNPYVRANWTPRHYN